MVPLSPSFKETFEKIETNLKYLIDLDLSEEETLKDPLALALYYHYIEEHDIQAINKTSLVAWARTYCHEKTVEQKLSRKRDTEITAAALAFSTLKKDKGYPEDKIDKIQAALKQILEKEKDKEGLYFGRPNFSAIILYGAKQAGIKLNGEKETLKTLLNKYKTTESLNNILGIPFLAESLILDNEEEELEKLAKKVRERLKNKLLEYDDKLYLTHALWEYHEHKKTLQEIRPLVESAVSETPIMLSDIINKGDISDLTVRQDNLKISRLYKALLLDLTTKYRKNSEQLRQEELDQRYSGESGLKWGAFTAYSALSIIVTAGAAYALTNSLKACWSFWILQQTQTTWQQLTWNTAASILTAYLLTFSIVGIYSLYTSFIGKRLVKDVRVWDHYKQHQKKALKWFCITILGAFILGIVTQLAATAVQNFLSKKG